MPDQTRTVVPCPGTMSFNDYKNMYDPPKEVKTVWIQDSQTGKLDYIPAFLVWFVSLLTWTRALDVRGMKLETDAEGSLIHEVAEGRKLVVIPVDEKITDVQLTHTHSVTLDHSAVAKVCKERASPDQVLTNTFLEECVKELVKRGIRRPVQELFVTTDRKILWFLIVDDQVKIMTGDGKYFLLPIKKTITFDGFSITVL